MRSLLVAAVLAGALPAQAAEFRTLAESATVMYDAPSRAAVPLYVASRFYPLEIIVNLDAWVKVRDHVGTLSWVEKKALSERRMVIVTAPGANVHGRAEDGSPVLFRVAQNVALELVEIAQAGWLRVRHADGSAGFIKAAFVWGI